MTGEVQDREIRLLSTGEVAALLGASRQHVVNMCNRGDLAFTWVGQHRRVHRSDVERVLGDNGRDELTRDQEKSLWLHRALLGRLVAEPEEVMGVAKSNAQRILQEQSRVNMTSRWLREWLSVLDGGVDETAEILTSRSSRAVELRQNSPFAGALPQETRERVLAAFVKHWREEYSARGRGAAISASGNTSSGRRRCAHR